MTWGGRGARGGAWRIRRAIDHQHVPGDGWYFIAEKLAFVHRRAPARISEDAVAAEGGGGSDFEEDDESDLKSGDRKRKSRREKARRDSINRLCVNPSDPKPNPACFRQDWLTLLRNFGA